MTGSPGTAVQQTPAAGRARSLGSSLLDQVLAETLDPSYTAAARARAARRRATAESDEAARRAALVAGTAVPATTVERRRPGQIAVAAVMVFVGLLATVTYRESASGAQGREQVRQALIRDISTQSDTSDDLVQQLAQLRRQVTERRDGALATSSEGQRALAELAAAEQGAALLAVSGPGLVITLADAPADADSDPVGGNPQVAAGGLVQDRDLQLVVNALWAAGAEAISINGQRLGTTTAIRLAGNTILVDFRPVVSPYEVSAIGDRGPLQDRFINSPEASELVDVAVAYGIVFDFVRRDDLELPASGGAELRWARPVDPAATGGPASASPGAPPSGSADGSAPAPAPASAPAAAGTDGPGG